MYHRDYCLRASEIATLLEELVKVERLHRVTFPRWFPFR